MREVAVLVDRNRKLFFKDKGMLFSSMITPLILIVLYATFLAKVYKDSYTSEFNNMIELSDKMINGAVAAQLSAALIAVSCVTVTFCVNLTMVQDRANGTRRDFDVSPVSRSKIYIGYFLSTVVNSLMVNSFALVLCLLYVLKMGWT
jgi:multidrug/hemolysin transport system permease protein